MLYAVTIAPLNAIYFVSDRPDDNPWEVQEGVELEIDPLYGPWTPDLGPLRQSLYISTSDPKYYRVLLHSKDPGLREYRPTGRYFAGFFSKSAWERIAKSAPGIIAALCTGDDDPTGDTEEAPAAIDAEAPNTRRGRTCQVDTQEQIHVVGRMGGATEKLDHRLGRGGPGATEEAVAASEQGGRGWRGSSCWTPVRWGTRAEGEGAWTSSD